MNTTDTSTKYDTPEEILRSIISSYGTFIIQDPKKFQAIFNDYNKGRFIRESNIIKQSLEQQIPNDLLETSNVPYPILFKRLVLKLDEIGIRRDLAEWAVKSWVYALGIVPHTTFNVTINTVPTNAQIFLDNHLLGNSPLSIDLGEGIHNIKCSVPGYQDWNENIPIKDDSKVDITLVPKSTSGIFDGTITGRFEKNEVVGLLAILCLLTPFLLMYIFPDAKLGNGLFGDIIAILSLVLLLMFFIFGFMYGGYLFPIKKDTKIFKKNPFLAAILSCIWPGLGQIYNGQFKKGGKILILLILSFVLITIVVGIVMLFILWIYSVYDAFITASKINQTRNQ